jgi:hypothetical protein
LIVGTAEIADLFVDVGAIPQSQLRRQKKVDGWGKFLTVDLVAEMEVSNEVSFKIKRRDIVEKIYKTNLKG